MKYILMERAWSAWLKIATYVMLKILTNVIFVNMDILLTMMDNVSMMGACQITPPACVVLSKCTSTELVCSAWLKIADSVMLKILMSVIFASLDTWSTMKDNVSTMDACPTMPHVCVVHSKFM